MVLFSYEGAALEPGAAVGHNNLYVWEAGSGTYRLAGVFNDGKAPPGGARAGAADASPGGAYTHDQNALSTDGKVLYFTAGGTEQLYMRLNPAKPQSLIDEGECVEPDRACTYHVSETQRTAKGPDPAGAQHSHFRAASADGSVAYFTSSEMLTEDANTGPEKEPAQIGQAKIGASEAEEEKLDFLPAHAFDVTTANGYVYWTNPGEATIGRAKLDGSEPANPNFIEIPPTKFESHPYSEPGVIQPIPSRPRYLAVTSEYVYWTNTGFPEYENEAWWDSPTTDRRIGHGRPCQARRLGQSRSRQRRTGIHHRRIGSQGDRRRLRTRLLGKRTPLRRPRFPTYAGPRITSGQQRRQPGLLRTSKTRAMALATFLDRSHSVAASSILELTQNLGGYGSIDSYQLATCEKAAEQNFVGVEGGIRDLTISGPHVYWTTVTTEKIGRIPVSDFQIGGCPSIPTCDEEFVSAPGNLGGLAIDGDHVYWSSNGEQTPNPGSDLYRYEAGASEPLTDITPDATDENGAEVKGVLGSSERRLLRLLCRQLRPRRWRKPGRLSRSIVQSLCLPRRRNDVHRRSCRNLPTGARRLREPKRVAPIRPPA